MLIFEDRKFIQASFTSEAELENVVIENAESIFGPSSIYFPKMLFKTGGGAGTIPDGFVIDPSTRQWFIVEAELAIHGAWNHIIPQVTKQIIAASQPLSKQLLMELAVKKISEDDSVQEKFTELGIREIDIRKLLNEILNTDPIIAMPIDAIPKDVKEWAATLTNEVKLWVIKKHIEFGHPQNIVYEIPEEYKPTLDTQVSTDISSGLKQYDVTLIDLIKNDILAVNESLTMTYGPKNSQKKTYEGIIKENGSIEVLGNVFDSPSYAALFGIQDSGSDRKTVNGWTSWKTSKGQTLADLRDQLLSQIEKNKESPENSELEF